MTHALLQITADQDRTTATTPKVLQLNQAYNDRLAQLAQALANAPEDRALRDRMQTLLAHGEPLPIADTTPLTAEVEIIGDPQQITAFIAKHQLREAINTSTVLANERLRGLLHGKLQLELEQAPDGWTHLFLVCPTLASWSERHEHEDALMDAWLDALTPAQTEHFTLDVRCVR